MNAIKHILGAVAFFTICMGATVPASAEVTMRVIVFGDSLTSGYMLQSEESYPIKLDRKLRSLGYSYVEVINMSVPGESTTASLDRMPQLTAKRPDVVVLALGANDMLRGINVGVIYKNLATIISRLVQDDVYVILMGVKAPPGTGYGYAAQIDDTYQRLAEAYKLPFYPSILEGVAGQANLTLADGFHPSGKGVDHIVEQTYRMVDEGLRWKWSVVQYQQQYQQYQQNTYRAGPNQQGGADPQIQELLKQQPPSVILAPPE